MLQQGQIRCPVPTPLLKLVLQLRLELPQSFELVKLPLPMVPLLIKVQLLIKLLQQLVPTALVIQLPLLPRLAVLASKQLPTEIQHSMHQFQLVQLETHPSRSKHLKLRPYFELVALPFQLQQLK